MNHYSRPVPVMTVAEVTLYLKVHPMIIYHLARERKMPAFRVNSDWLFNREQIDEWPRAQQIDTERLVKR